MTYTPNFNDPRVNQRIKKAYGFARAVLTEKPHSWSTRYIDKYFGCNNRDLGKWLRSQLLICTNNRYNKDAGITKEYKLNIQGANYIRSVMRGQNDVVPATTTGFDFGFIELNNQDQYDREVVFQFVKQEWGTDLDSKAFQYQDKNSRLWHPLQNVRREARTRAFAEHNLCYQYDISTAAPTLIHQHSQQQQDPMDLYLFALRRYLKDKTQVREELAAALEVDIKTAKTVINALFCGAKIGYGPEFALSQLLEHDKAKILYLKNDAYIQQLRNDIKICWQYITPSMARRSKRDKNGCDRMLPISSKEKWMRYFDLERRCLDQVIKYLASTNNKCFLEHDGWTCEKPVNLSDLQDYVYQMTGLDVKFEVKRVLSDIDRKSYLSRIAE